jgi:hypothetical protein
MYSQAGQDKMIVQLLGTEPRHFLEIGSAHAIEFNNTYLLESKYGWTGIMVEYDGKYEDTYKEHRTSKYLIQDATTVDYRTLMDSMNFPEQVGFLQIDLEVNNRSTLSVLEKLDNTVFDKYTFGFVAFEHDIYTGNHYNTRERSREIFKKRGYVPVAEDVLFDSVAPFEDWYVHPSIVSPPPVKCFMPWEKIVSTINDCSSESVHQG